MKRFLILGLLFFCISVQASPEEELFNSVIKGNAPAVKKALEQNPVMNRKYNFGKTILFFAVEGGKDEIVQMILDHSSQSGSHSLAVELDDNLQSAGHYAAARGHLNILKMLITHGLDMLHKNRQGQNILDIAHNYGHTETVSFLEIEKNIRPNRKMEKDGLALGLYTIYLLISIALTVWVARTLSTNGRIFLIDSLSNEKLADSVNHLLVVGFYLLNIGYITLAMKIEHKPDSFVQSLELLSTKIGFVLVILGIIHFFNIFMFGRLRKKTSEKRAERERSVLQASLSDS